MSGKSSTITDDIIDLLEPSKIEGDALVNKDIVLDLMDVLTGLSLRLRRKEGSASGRNSESNSEVSNVDLRVSTRLSKPGFAVFRGNPLDWQTFWDQFQNWIHKNVNLNDIDNFNYLNKYARVRSFNHYELVFDILE